MTRRSSAFDDDLAGLDDLARLPLPKAAAAEPAADDPALSAPDVAADGGDEQTREDGAEAPAHRVGVRSGPVAWLRPAAGEGTTRPDVDVRVAPGPGELEQRTPAGLVPASAGQQPDDSQPTGGQASGAQGRSRSSTTQTAVRLPMPVAKWLSDQAARQQLTFSSVIVQAVRAHREELAPELQAGDGLLVKRRPRTHSAPVTLRFTPAQRELVDGMAQTFGCTRSALVLAALQAAMGTSARS